MTEKIPLRRRLAEAALSARPWIHTGAIVGALVVEIVRVLGGP